VQDGEDRAVLIGQLFERTCECSTLNDDQCLSQLFQRDQKAPSELAILSILQCCKLVTGQFNRTTDNTIASIHCNKTLALHG